MATAFCLGSEPGRMRLQHFTVGGQLNRLRQLHSLDPAHAGVRGGLSWGCWSLLLRFILYTFYSTLLYSTGARSERTSTTSLRLDSAL